MFRFRRLFPFFLVAAAGAAFVGCHRHSHGAFSKACKDPDGQDQKAEKASKHIARKLDLTQEQRLAVRGVVKDAMQDICQGMPPHEELKSRIISDLRADQADTAAIGATMGQALERLGKLKGDMLEHYAVLHETLTPEQRMRLASLLEKRFGG